MGQTEDNFMTTLTYNRFFIVVVFHTFVFCLNEQMMKGNALYWVLEINLCENPNLILVLN